MNAKLAFVVYYYRAAECYR